MMHLLAALPFISVISEFVVMDNKNHIVFFWFSELSVTSNLNAHQLWSPTNIKLF